MSDLKNILSDPAIITLLSRTNPEIGIAIQLVSSLLNTLHKDKDVNEAIKLIDARAAIHVKRLITEDLGRFERTEIEVRLHELLTLVCKVGGLS